MFFRGMGKNKKVINSVATIVLGKKHLKKWFNRVCEEASERRKVARRNWLNYTNNGILFGKFKTQINNKLRNEKRNYLQGIMENAEG